MFTGCSIARHENTLSPFSFPSPPPQPSSQNFPLPLPSPLPIRSLAELNQTDEGPSAFHALNIRLITFSYVLLDEQPTLRSINTRVPRTPCRYLTSGKKISGWMDERMDGRMVFRIDRGQKLETRGASHLLPPCYSDYVARRVYLTFTRVYLTLPSLHPSIRACQAGEKTGGK